MRGRPAERMGGGCKEDHEASSCAIVGRFGPRLQIEVVRTWTRVELSSLTCRLLLTVHSPARRRISFIHSTKTSNLTPLTRAPNNDDNSTRTRAAANDTDPTSITARS